MTAPSRLPETQAVTQRRLRELRGRLRVLVDGRLVAPVAQHGSESTYNNWMCRCVPCAEVARVNKRERREREKRAAVARLARIRAAAGRGGR